jgi:hypothetical protein
MKMKAVGESGCMIMNDRMKDGWLQMKGDQRQIQN